LTSDEHGELSQRTVPAKEIEVILAELEKEDKEEADKKK
jgi:hypothetical protein